MKTERPERPLYCKPEVRTTDAKRIVEALGPVSAGSGSSEPCGPLLENYCP
jgi:hypothetical protein